MFGDVDRPGHPEVRDLRGVPGKQDVVRADVTVEQFAIVGVGKAGEHLADDSRGGGRRERGLLVEPACE